jgi:hypothetical protein
MTSHGRGEGRRHYRCDDDAKRGTCHNAVSVREAVARECIPTGLRQTLLSSDAMACVRRRITEKFGEIARSGSAQGRQLRDRLAEVEARMERLVKALTSGTRGVATAAVELRDEDSKAKALRAELAAAEVVSRAPVRLPTPEDVLRVVADRDRVYGSSGGWGRSAPEPSPRRYVRASSCPARTALHRRGGGAPVRTSSREPRKRERRPGFPRRRASYGGGLRGPAAKVV